MCIWTEKGKVLSRPPARVRAKEHMIRVVRPMTPGSWADPQWVCGDGSPGPRAARSWGGSGRTLRPTQRRERKGGQSGARGTDAGAEPAGDGEQPETPALAARSSVRPRDVWAARPEAYREAGPTRRGPGGSSQTERRRGGTAAAPKTRPSVEL